MDGHRHSDQKPEKQGRLDGRGVQAVLYPSTALPKHDFPFPPVRSNNATKLCWESNSLLLYAFAICPHFLVKIHDFNLKFSILKVKGLDIQFLMLYGLGFFGSKISNIGLNVSSKDRSSPSLRGSPSTLICPDCIACGKVSF